MRSKDAEKKFCEALDKLGYHQNLWTAFNDFLDFSLLAMKWWEQNPDKYDEIKKKYSPENFQLFIDAFTAMGEVADNDGEGYHDPFGDYFMDHFANQRRGQFFTPKHLCIMMAALQGYADAPDGSTICDPCCGSGRMLLAVAQINRNHQFYAADIDKICCKMTVINFFMNGMTGEVAWMDTIRLTHWHSWHLTKALTTDGQLLPYYYETGPGETRFIDRLPKNDTNESVAAVEPTVAPQPEKKKKQLLLFGALASKKSITPEEPDSTTQKPKHGTILRKNERNKKVPHTNTEAIHPGILLFPEPGESGSMAVQSLPPDESDPDLVSEEMVVE